MAEEFSKEEDLELIDTLWNVNYLFPLIMTELFRINRYIMECKSFYNHTIIGYFLN